MKNRLLIVFVALGCTANMLAMESWRFRLGYYICSKLYKKPTQEEQFPIVDALIDDFCPLFDKNNRPYKTADGYEFDLVAAAKGSYPQLNTRCSKLDFLNCHSFSMSVKDAALLQFARAMADHEKEWKTWHTAELKTEAGIKRHFFGATINQNGNDEVIRQDQNSPHYQWGKISPGNEKIYQLNARENTAYHDELRFLQTQQHKMELYGSIEQDALQQKIRQKIWNDMPLLKKIFYYASYQKSSWLDQQEHASYQEEQQLEMLHKSYQELKQEIVAFKDNKNRKAFTRSYMQKKNFRFVQKSREAYRTSQNGKTE